MARLALLRHGPTSWNEAGRIQGRADPPLSDAGRSTVSAWRLPPDVASFAWVASPLLRCRETATLLASGAYPAPQIASEPRLVEMDWGAWEGRTLAELRSIHGSAMQTREQRGLDFRPPRGESPRQVLHRLQPWLAALGAAGIDTLAVTHKGVIRVTYAWATGWEMLGKPPAKLEDAAVHLFAVAVDGQVTVEQLNLPLVAGVEDGRRRGGGA